MLKCLLDGTARVSALADGKITSRDFLQAYGNFYYYNALDGHEATPEQQEVLQDNVEVCWLHERVQSIVDLVYTSDEPKSEYEAVGRIRDDEAGRRIVTLAEEMDVSSLISKLRIQIDESD